MKKLFIVFVSALLVFGFVIQARAEISTVGYTGKRFEEQQVFVMAYNDSGGTVNSREVVILDTGETAGSTLGAYITQSTTADDVSVFGVADEEILDGSVGRICVRGPARIIWETGTSIALGDLIGVSDETEGSVQEYATSDGTTGGVLGHAIKTNTTSGDVEGWIWVEPRVHK